MFSFCCNMIFMIPVRNSFHSNSRGLVSFDNTTIFSPNTTLEFSTAVHWSLTRHCRWHGNFELPTSVFHDVLEFLILRINEVHPRKLLAWSSFGFSMAHFCFSLRLDASDLCFHTSGHNFSGLEVVYFLVSLPADHIFSSCGVSLKIVNCPGPCIWLFTICIHVPVIFNIVLQHYVQSRAVVVVTSMYFIGIGNVCSCGAYSLTLGTTWWR